MSPVRTIPSTKYFWAMKNKIKTGSKEYIDPTIIRFQGISRKAEIMPLMPMGSVNLLSVLRYITGVIKSFQVHKNVKIETVAIAGLHSGRAIFHQVLNSLQPSILAASNKSLGSEPKNCLSKNIIYAEPKNEGTINGRKLSTQPIFLNNKY